MNADFWGWLVSCSLATFALGYIGARLWGRFRFRQAERRLIAAQRALWDAMQATEARWAAEIRARANRKELADAMRAKREE